MPVDEIARTQINAHENLCNIRQGQILKRIDRLEAILISVCAFLLCAMGKILWDLSVLAHSVR